MGHDIAFATCARLQGQASPDRELEQELTSRGHRVHHAVWDDSEVDWSKFKVTVIRSTWDYQFRPHDFNKWLDDVEKLPQGRVWNSVDILRWNMEKHYLNDLEASGIRIVPSVFTNKIGSNNLVEIATTKGWKSIVVKPTISADSYLTRRLTGQGQMEAHQAELDKSVSQGLEFIIQRYMPTVHTAGEWALMYFNKKFSHSVNRTPQKDDFRVQSGYNGIKQILDAPQKYKDFAARVLQKIEADLLYARVDMLEDEAGDVMLGELELLEPGLFIADDEHAAARMADELEHFIRKHS